VKIFNFFLHRLHLRLKFALLSIKPIAKLLEPRKQLGLRIATCLLSNNVFQISDRENVAEIHVFLIFNKSPDIYTFSLVQNLKKRQSRAAVHLLAYNK
jgi:hypothetical protein